MQNLKTDDLTPWRVRAGWRLTITSLLAAACLGGTARAQTANRFLLDQYFPTGIPGYGNALGVTVLSRQRPDYDPLGVRVGDFIIRPEIDQSLGYTSNLLGQKGGQGSFEEQTAGSLRAASDWGRNSLAGEVTFDDRRTPSLSQENRTDWTATLGGTHDFGRDTLTLTASHLSLHQDPTDIDARVLNLPGQFFSAPLPFQMNDLRASYATTFGRFTVTPEIEFTNITFGNLRVFGLNGAGTPPVVGGTVLGVPSNQGYRDRNLYSGGVIGRYEFAPLHNAVLLVRDINTTYYSATRNLYGPNRSSNGIEVMAGLDYTASGVWRYRALVGYEVRKFNNREYKTHAAPVAEANVIWQPTGLTTVTGRVVHTIEDAADESISGYDYTSARLQVDHEYLRNVLLTGYVGLQRADYLQSNLNETFYGGGVGATWLINRNIHLAATYDLSQRVASASFGGNYMASTALLTAKFGL